MPHTREASPVNDIGPMPEDRLLLNGFEETLLVSRLMHQEAAVEAGPLAEQMHEAGRLAQLGEMVVDKYLDDGEVALSGSDAELVFGALHKAADRLKQEEPKTISQLERQKRGDDRLAASLLKSYDAKTGLLRHEFEPVETAALEDIRSVAEERGANNVVSIEDYIPDQPHSVLAVKGETGEHVAVFRSLREVIAAQRLVDKLAEEEDTPPDARIVCEEVEAALAKLTDEIGFGSEKNPYLIEGEGAEIVEAAFIRGAKRAGTPESEIFDAIAAEMIGMTKEHEGAVVETLPATQRYRVLPVVA